jgi:glycosyltransferase involved in cell wall biosynthesis
LADWECVLINDGSTDTGPAVATRFAAADARIRVITTAHQGLVAALNAGLAQCRGRYVARMDADDLMHRERLREQLEGLEQDSSLSALGCHVRVFPRSALTEGARAYERWLNGIRSADCVRRDAFVECPLVHPSWMIRREVLTRVGYRDRGWPEDYDLLLRLLGDGLRIGVLPRRRLCWRDRPERLWRTAREYGQDRFTDCKAFHLANTLLAETDQYILWGYGSTGRALRRALGRLGKRPAYIVELHPGRLGNLIHGAPVIPPDRLRDVGRAPLLVSVAGAPQRQLIRTALAEMGFVETADYVCAA